MVDTRKRKLAALLLMLSVAIGMAFIARPNPIRAADPAAPLPQPTPRGALPETRVSSEDLGQDDHLGQSIALDGDWLLAGAPASNHPVGEDTGAAYLFQRHGETWKQVTRLFVQDPQAGAFFGWSVALDGGTAVVGAPYAASESGGSGAGGVYVFEGESGSWRQTAKLTAADGFLFDLFGWSLALDEDTLLVGARAADGPDGRRNSGAAYVYHRQEGRWFEQARLAPPQAEANSFFGHAVALHEDWAAVGAFLADDPQVGVNRGAVYLFRRINDQWFHAGQLQPEGVITNAQFGFALDFDREGNRLLVGANMQNSGGTDVDMRYMRGITGAAYLFERQGESWVQAARIMPESTEAMERGEEGPIGWAVAVGEDRSGEAVVIVGGMYARGLRLYREEGGQWQEAMIVDPSEFAGVLYGRVLDANGTTLAVGAPFSHNYSLTNQGSVAKEGIGAVLLYDLGAMEP